jgi:hypothetical protein
MLRSAAVAAVRLREVWIVVVVFAVLPVDRTARSGCLRSRTRALRSQWLQGVAAERGPPRPLAFP